MLLVAFAIVPAKQERALLRLEEVMRGFWEDLDEGAMDMRSPLCVALATIEHEFSQQMMATVESLARSDLLTRIPQFLPEIRSLLELKENLQNAIQKLVADDVWGDWGLITTRLAVETGLPVAVIDAFTLRIVPGRGVEVMGIEPLLTGDHHLTPQAYGAAVTLVALGLMDSDDFDDLPDLDPKCPTLDDD